MGYTDNKMYLSICLSIYLCIAASDTQAMEDRPLYLPSLVCSHFASLLFHLSHPGNCSWADDKTSVMLDLRRVTSL